MLLCNPCVPTWCLIDSDDLLFEIPLHYGKRYLVNKKGELYDSFAERFKSNKVSSEGYVRNTLTSDNNVNTSYGRHQLIALTFIPNPLDKPIVNHKDRIRSNNHVTNLEWNTVAENNGHRVIMYKSHGLSPYSVKHKRREN